MLVVLALQEAEVEADHAMEVEVEDLTEEVRAQTIAVIAEVTAVAMEAAEEIVAATVATAAANVVAAMAVVITTAVVIMIVAAQVGMATDLTVAAVDVEDVEDVMKVAEDPMAVAAVAIGMIVAMTVVTDLTKTPGSRTITFKESGRDNVRGYIMGRVSCFFFLLFAEVKLEERSHFEMSILQCYRGMINNALDYVGSLW